MVADLLLKSLEHIWKTLEPLGVPMAVTGGVALAAWEYLRATRDVDLLIAIGEPDIADLLKRLREAQIRPKHDPPVRPLGQVDLMQVLYEPPATFLDLQIDLLIARSPYHEQALARRVTTQLPGLALDLSIVACEDIILLKLQAGRIVDLADAASILRLNRSALDVGYLMVWSRKLPVEPALMEIWREALPDEELPRGATDG